MGSDHSQPREYQLTEDLADSLSLREGQLLRARVVSRFPESDGKLLIEINGRRVIAKSKLDVDENQALLVQVESLSRPIELSLYEPTEAREKLTDADLRNYLENNNIDPSEESVEFLRTWLEESLPLRDSRLKDAMDRHDLLENAEDLSAADKMWGFCFLEERGFPVNEQTLDMVSRVRNLDDDRAWTRFMGQNAGQFEASGEFPDLRNGVSFVGFDLVNRLGKRPREAAQTLHARLLKTLNGQSTGLNAPASLLKSLLGQILGVALVNLENRDEFLFFLPLLQGNQIRLAWVGGRVQEDQPFLWHVNAHMTLSRLGTIGMTIDRKVDELKVVLTSESDDIAELLRHNKSGLASRLSSLDESVRVTVRNEEPRLTFEAFTIEDPAGHAMNQSFATGLDLTV